jgi:hypothetical protein
MKATGREAKALKEAEVEEATSRASESNFNETKRSTGRCLGCRAPGPGLCGGCGSYINDTWNGR